MFGISYYPGAQTHQFEWYIQGNIDLTMARAAKRTIGSHGEKPGGTVVLVPFADTDAKYKKSSLSAGLGVGADMPLTAGFSLTANAGYRFAQLGTMEGDINQFGVHTTQASATEFDFSGLQISAGLRYDL
jgi:opacity protein-like surface antigen